MMRLEEASQPASFSIDICSPSCQQLCRNIRRKYSGSFTDDVSPVDSRDCAETFFFYLFRLTDKYPILL